MVLDVKTPIFPKRYGAATKETLKAWLARAMPIIEGKSSEIGQPACPIEESFSSFNAAVSTACPNQKPYKENRWDNRWVRPHRYPHKKDNLCFKSRSAASSTLNGECGIAKCVCYVPVICDIIVFRPCCNFWTPERDHTIGSSTHEPVCRGRLQSCSYKRGRVLL